MPIGPRSSTPFQKNYLHDELLNSITEPPNSREVFMRIKLLADNTGRLPGNPAVLASYLFPRLQVTPAAMKQFLDNLVKRNLIFRYNRGPECFVEVCDNGATSKLVGNMKAVSDFPPPPEELVREWEQRTGRKWKAIAKGSSADESTGSNEYERESTGSNEYERVRLKGREVKGSEAKRREYDGAKAAPTVSTSLTETKSPTEKSFKALMQGDPHSLAKRLKVFTGERFEPALMREYEFTNDFYEIFNEAAKRNEDLPATRANVIHVMAEVMNEGKTKELAMPKGWYPILKALREEEKSA